MRVNAIDGAGGIARLHAALDASCVVGIWEWDHVRRVVVLDAGAAQLMLGDPGLGEVAISGARALASVHPADHDQLIAHLCQGVRRGGPVLAEYRVLAPDGEVRRLLSRGRTYLDEAGAPVHTRGILIDVTETPDDDASGPEASPPADSRERAVDLAIALKQVLGADAPAEVQLLTDLLLMRLGRAVAVAALGH